MGKQAGKLLQAFLKRPSTVQEGRPEEQALESMVPGGFFRDLERQERRTKQEPAQGRRLLHSSTQGAGTWAVLGGRCCRRQAEPRGCCSEPQGLKATARVRVLAREPQPEEVTPVSSCVRARGCRPVIPS